MALFRVCWMDFCCEAVAGSYDCKEQEFLAVFSACFRWRRRSALFMIAHFPARLQPIATINEHSNNEKTATRSPI